MIKTMEQPTATTRPSRRVKDPSLCTDVSAPRAGFRGPAGVLDHDDVVIDADDVELDTVEDHGAHVWLSPTRRRPLIGQRGATER